MIICFSGTGNSTYCAKKLSSLTGDTLVFANPLIKGGEKGVFTSDEPYVFVAPTYSWQIPHIFTAFLKRSDFEGNENAYFVMTCGDDIGNADKYNRAIAESIGLTYKGTAAIKMPENYIAMFDVPEKNECIEIIKNAEKSLSGTAKIISEGGFIPYVKVNVTDRLKSGIVNTLFYNLCVKSKAFRVGESCTGCGKCEKLCPANAVRCVDGKPVWGEGCTHCMACISYCPARAIEYGKKSVGKSRYTCENILKGI